MRVYLSGPITGTADARERFANAQKELQELGYDVVNPELLSDIMPKDSTHEEYMRVCYALLDCCETIYMLKKWDLSKGANMEFKRAAAYGMNILFEGGGVCPNKQRHVSFPRHLGWKFTRETTEPAYSAK